MSRTARARSSPSGPGRTSFETRHGRLEVIRNADGIGGYGDWVLRASEENFGEGLIVVVAAAEDILASKQAAGRAEDAAVLKQMRKDLNSQADPLVTSRSARRPTR